MKIQVRELMIGNMILVNHPDIDKGILAIIKSISETTCWVKDPKGWEFEIDNDFLFPIPLTEEWLFRFGLKTRFQNGTDQWTNDEMNKIRPLGIELKSNGNFSLVTGKYYLQTVKYVHELQNLYFALTGQELTLKSEQ